MSAQNAAARAAISAAMRDDALPPLARRGLVGAVVVAHLGAAWGVLQIESVRQAVAEVAPLVVDFIAPPPPPAPPVPPPPPPAAPRVLPPPPTPLIATAPSTQPGPAAMTVAPPPPEPVAAPAEPTAPPAPPAPVARTIPSTAVSYLEPPAPVYPRASRRQGEQGEVWLKVEIGADGRARQVLVSRSSGHIRLDDAALAAVRAARFKPYTENGVPQVVWTTVPIQFELEK